MKRSTPRKSNNRSGVSKSIYAWLPVIFIIAMTYRFFYFMEVRHHPLFENTVIDARYHHDQAQRIAAGQILGSGPDDVFKPWLYPLLIGLVYSAADAKILFVQWFQFFLGAVSACLAAVAASMLYGRGIGIAAGLLCALYAPFLFFEGQLLTPSVSIFFNLWILIMLLQTRPRWGGIGCLGGLAAAVRPDVLLPFALAAGWRLTAGTNRTESNTRGKAIFHVVFGFALVAVPFIARHYSLTRQFGFAGTNAGINFYVGNGPEADGVSAVPTGLAWEKLLSRLPRDRMEDPSYTSRFWSHATWTYIIGHPMAWLRGEGVKAAAFFNGREFRNNIGYEWFRRDVRTLNFPFIQYRFLAVLTLVSVSLLLLKSDADAKKEILLVIWIAGYMIGGCLFFVNARYRLPAVPFMIVLSAGTVARSWRRIKSPDRRFAGKLLGALVLAGIFTWPGWFDKKTGANEQDFINLGNIFREKGDSSQAIDAYRNALRDNPSSADAWFLAGTTFLLSGQLDMALYHLREAERLDPEGADILLNLGYASQSRGNTEEAERYYLLLIDLAKKRNLKHKASSIARAWLGLHEIERLEGNIEAGGKHMENAWQADPRTAAEYAIVHDLDPQRAIRYFTKIADDNPRDWYSLANIGIAYMKMHEYEKAIPFFEKAVANRGAMQGVRFQLGMALMHAGRRSDAREAFHHLLAVLPESGLKQDVRNALETMKTQE